LAALAATGGQSAAPALLAAMASTDPSVRVQALSGLSQLGGPEAERALLTASQDKDPGVANGAIQYLGRVKTSQALGRLEEVALGTNADRSQQALGALANAAPARAAGLAERLFQSADPSARVSAARVAASLPADQAERLMTAAARDSDPNVVREAIGNLQSIGGPAANGILVEILKREGAAPDVRSMAAQVLSQLGGRAAEENASLIQQLVASPAYDATE
jgi:HEAT repeat protein